MKPNDDDKCASLSHIEKSRASVSGLSPQAKTFREPRTPERERSL